MTAKGTVLDAVQANEFSGTLATFTDDNPDATTNDYYASIAWGDGTTTGGTIVGLPAGGFAVTGSYLYDQAGPEFVTVTIYDFGGSTAVASAR